MAMGLKDRMGAAWRGLMGRERTGLSPEFAAAMTMMTPAPAAVAQAAVGPQAAALVTVLPKREGLIGVGIGEDPEDYQYRKLTGSGNKAMRRELNPIVHSRMLEIVWYLWEHNPLAKRLVTFMTDMILGEGVTVDATDPRIQEVLDATWNHRVNQMKTRAREFHNSLALSGELILPVAINPITGIPTLGFVDSAQVHAVIPNVDNILIPEFVELKPDVPGQPGRRLKIVQPDPVTGLLDGEVFFHAVNKLPNSMRGRSDLLPLADWLDLYDTYLFAEVERLQLLSSFVWDYKVEGADEPTLKEKARKLPNPKPGTVFVHNEKESLDARSPELRASDRSEAGRMLRLHIAGTYGFPLTWLGESEGSNATIQGQNDVMSKTPTARQIEYRGFLDLIVRFSIEKATTKNPALFRDAGMDYKIRMPELQAKDISRVGAVLGQVVTAMDLAMQNNTASRRLAITVMAQALAHMGVEANPQAIMDEADQDRDDKDAQDELIQAEIARRSAADRTDPNDDPALAPDDRLDEPAGSE